MPPVSLPYEVTSAEATSNEHRQHQTEAGSDAQEPAMSPHLPELSPLRGLFLLGVGPNTEDHLPSEWPLTPPNPVAEGSHDQDRPSGAEDTGTPNTWSDGE